MAPSDQIYDHAENNQPTKHATDSCTDMNASTDDNQVSECLKVEFLVVGIYGTGMSVKSAKVPYPSRTSSECPALAKSDAIQTADSIGKEE